MQASRMALLVATLVGVTAGIGGFTFVYARGYSYLTNDPAACALGVLDGTPLGGDDVSFQCGQLRPRRLHVPSVTM